MGAKTNYFENLIIDWKRGQAMPVVSTWYFALGTSSAGKHAVSTAFALNDTVFIETDALGWRLYECTTAGTTAATKPSYPGVEGEAITDGGAVFTEQTADIEAATGVVEPSGGSYARPSVSAALTEFKSTQDDNLASTGTSGQTSNTNDIVFSDPTGDWGWCGMVILYDAVSAGNAYEYGFLASPVNITNGITPVSVPAGQFQYTEG